MRMSSKREIERAEREKRAKFSETILKKRVIGWERSGNLIMSRSLRWRACAKVSRNHATIFNLRTVGDF